MLYDWSVHLLDHVLTLVDSEPISVFCELDKVRFQDVDDYNRIVINFANGLKAHITVDTWCYIGEPRWKAFYENIVECLEEKATQMVTHEQIRKRTKIVDACFYPRKI